MSIFRTAQIVSLTLLLSSATLLCSAAPGEAGPEPATARYQGQWVSVDGTVRENLLPDHRYEEWHGSTVYRGTYRIQGEHIEYWDDRGFVADGDFLDGALHQSGTVLVRNEQANL